MVKVNKGMRYIKIFFFFIKFILLKNKHKGKEAILIGNGPSVRIEDLLSISKSDKIIFVFNRFYLSYEQYDLDFFKPDYIVSIDPEVIKDFAPEIIKNNHGADVLLGTKKTYPRGNYKKFFIKNKKPFKISEYLPFQRIPTGDSVVITAINIAYYMGIKKMYLYGIDHNFNSKEKLSDGKVVGGNNHFLNNYRDGKAWYFPKIESIENSFKESDKFLRAKNGFLINCSRFTKLEVIEKKNLEECLLIKR
jgi:hypothetical protein